MGRTSAPEPAPRRGGPAHVLGRACPGSRGDRAPATSSPTAVSVTDLVGPSSSTCEDLLALVAVDTGAVVGLDPAAGIDVLAAAADRLAGLVEDARRRSSDHYALLHRVLAAADQRRADATTRLTTALTAHPAPTPAALTALLEDADTAHARHLRALVVAVRRYGHHDAAVLKLVDNGLGELHGALDELADRLRAHTPDVSHRGGSTPRDPEPPA